MKGGNVLFAPALVVLICAFLSPLTAADQILKIDGQVRSTELLKTVPGQLNYQGHLADVSDSAAITATLEMTFRIFDSETKGAELWSETHPAVEVTGGLFQVLLGSVTAFPAGLFDGSPLWLQTEVGTEVLTPRKPLVSAAYSQRAETADHAVTADWATDAQNAVHADTADICPGLSAWTVSGDDVYRETGKVGIGTTSPLTELDVAGSVNATTYYGDGSNLTGISGTTDNDWTIDGDDIYHETGMVGVGTASPTHILDVAGHQLIQGPDGFDSTGDEATLYLGDTNKYLRATYSGNTALISNDPLRFHCGVDTSQFYMNVVGNVGIGTDAPTQKLDVDGAVNATTYYGDGSNLTGISGTTDNDWTIDGNDVYHETGMVGIGTSSPVVALDVDGAVRIGTGVQLLEISQDGQLWDMDDPVTINDCLAVLSTSASYFKGFLGIGTTSPSVNLQIKGTATTVGIVDTAGGSTNIYMAASGHDTWQLRTGSVGFSIKDMSTGADYLTVKTDGKIGIGTTSPSQGLHVAGHELIEGPDGFDNVGEQATLFLGDAGKYLRSTYGGSTTLYSNDPILLRTLGDANLLYLTSSGRVGIGTSSPSEKLQVAGSVEVDNDLIVTGAYKGTIGPNNGAPFPRPAYDSGWQSIDAGVPLGIVHDVGGDINDYVIDMQVNGGTSDRYLDPDEIYWDSLTATTMAVYRTPGNTTISTVRIRIWVYN